MLYPFNGGRGCFVAAIAFVAGTSFNPVARAQSVEEGRRHYLEADFDAAVDVLEQMLTKPSLTRDQALETHRYLATLYHLTGNADQGEAHAAAAVALDPSTSAPEGSPPEVEAAFTDAVQRQGGRRAEIEIDSDRAPEPGQDMEIWARLDPAPAALIDSLSLRCVAGAAPVEESQTPPEVRLTIRPAASEVHCRAVGRTAGHARLLTSQLTLSPDAPDGSLLVGGSPMADEDGGAPVWPWIVGGTVAVLAATAIVVFLIVRPFDSDEASLGQPEIEGW